MNVILRDHNGYAVPVSLRTSPMTRLFDHMLDDFFGNGGSTASETQVQSPRLDVIDTDKAYEIEVELPGVSKSDARIAIDKSRITLEAEVRRSDERKEGESVLHTERVIRKYARSFTLPAEVDDANAVAKMENGVLYLTLPKKLEKQPKQIQVQ